MSNTLTISHFLLYGLPCGVCGLPGHHSGRYADGVRTVHLDLRTRPCDSLRPAKRPVRRGDEPPRAPRRPPAPARSSMWTVRRSA
jgi:hypothetical protein